MALWESNVLEVPSGQGLQEECSSTSIKISFKALEFEKRLVVYSWQGVFQWVLCLHPYVQQGSISPLIGLVGNDVLYKVRCVTSDPSWKWI